MDEKKTPQPEQAATSGAMASLSKSPWAVRQPMTKPSAPAFFSCKICSRISASSSGV